MTRLPRKQEIWVHVPVVAPILSTVGEILGDLKSAIEYTAGETPALVDQHYPELYSQIWLNLD